MDFAVVEGDSVSRTAGAPIHGDGPRDPLDPLHAAQASADDRRLKIRPNKLGRVEADQGEGVLDERRSHSNSGYLVGGL